MVHARCYTPNHRGKGTMENTTGLTLETLLTAVLSDVVRATELSEGRRFGTTIGAGMPELIVSRGKGPTATCYYLNGVDVGSLFGLSQALGEAVALLYHGHVAAMPMWHHVSDSRSYVARRRAALKAALTVPAAPVAEVLS